MRSDRIARCFAWLIAGGAILAVTRSYAANEATPDWQWRLSPPDHLYAPYVADPRRPTNSFDLMAVDTAKIPDTGDMRFGLRIGGRFPLARYSPAGAPDRGFELSIEAGFRGLFDITNDLDVIGWDGLYGCHVAWAPRGGEVAFRFGTTHDSSHVGDEYAERTGRTRIDYTREEWIAGASVQLHRDWRTYAEVGWSSNLTSFEESWRAQTGIEWRSPRKPWDGRMNWYGAVDLNTFEENDWALDTTLQAGLMVPVEDAARTWRLAATFYDGRSLIGEFFQTEEHSLSIGLWLDF